MAAPEYTLIQITDLHIRAADNTSPAEVDTFAALRCALRAVGTLTPRPTAVLFTGDLTEDGKAEEYTRLRDLVAPALAELGVPAVFLPGNHDVRGALREHLLGEAPGAALDAAPLDSVRWFGGLRVVTLDSTVPGFAHGQLDAEQLVWLRAELSTPAPDGTVVALHHPPLPSFASLTSAIELRNPADLAASVTGTDVRAVLAGHAHMIGAGVLAGVPVWAGGPLASMHDSALPDGGLRGLSAPSLSRLDLYRDAAVTTHVPLGARTLWQLPAAQLAAQVQSLRAQLP